MRNLGCARQAVVAIVGVAAGVIVPILHAYPVANRVITVSGHITSRVGDRCQLVFDGIGAGADMPEWMIIMEFKDMGQMDLAFKRVAPLKGELEEKHRSFNQFVSGNIQHALFRDWPDTNL